MAITIGTQLGSHEIIALLGKGGMGEVYRARDLKLKRDVAIKILPNAFLGDADRVSRFQREAEVLASLNHPNIAGIHSIEEANSTRYLVLELVEGETLADRIARGPIPVEEALTIASTICEALEAAHEKGIIHRDLKPANVKITPDCKVKVLDFGLAKAISGAPANPVLSNSPTLLSGSVGGMIIGTAAYMSPEQARGGSADQRSDVFAFGCVLYELLTGKQAFTGETISDVIGGILRVDPDWNALPANVRPALRAVLKRCLEKDRNRRYHAIADARLDLEASEQTIAPVVAEKAEKMRAWIPWAVVGIIAAATIAALTLYMMRPSLSQPPAWRLSIDLPPEAGILADAAAPYPAISPDGQYVSFVAASGASRQLWIRPLSSSTAQPVPGTEGVNPYPFWSPDSRYIAFFAGTSLKKVSVAGGAPQTLCDCADASWLAGGTWSEKGDILFVKQESIERVSANGGPSAVVRRIDKSKNEKFVAYAVFLPDGNHFIYTVGIADSNQGGGTAVRIGALDIQNHDIQLALPGLPRPAGPRILYARPNHLMFVQNGTLMAQLFDPKSLSLKGDMFPVAEHVGSSSTGAGAFGVSDSGAVVYRPDNAPRSSVLTWFDRSGKNLGTVPVQGYFQGPRLSPDGQQVAVERSETSGIRNIWMIDLVRGTESRVTSDLVDNFTPIFSPDGQQIVFAANRSGAAGLYMKSASGLGADQLIQRIDAPVAFGASDWLRGGQVLAYCAQSIERIGLHCWAKSMAGDGRPSLLLEENVNQVRFSPDQHWFLYTSYETGRAEVNVQAFPPSGYKGRVSVHGGELGSWKNDGREIVFKSLDGKMMAVDVKVGQTFAAGVPRELFPIPGNIAGGRFAVTPDAQRFLIPLEPQAPDRVGLTIVTNWRVGGIK